jgi:uncharacterized protein YuzE
MFSQRLVLESPNLISLYLRSGVQAEQQKQGEIILDINSIGNWVRGFEMVGGFVPFSIAKAVSPFDPSLPTPSRIPEPGTVTFDPEADAAYFYLQYDSSLAQLTPNERTDLKLISHSINPTAIYGLDSSGGLVWVKIPIADAGPADQFVSLLLR